MWKLWFEAAQVEERAGNLSRSRARVRAVGACVRANLRWKVWLAARAPSSATATMAAAALLARAHDESPSKTRAIVMLEQSRLHELQGNVAAAWALLKTARRTNAQEWTVVLESVWVEVRAREPRNALREAKRALDKHRGTGRLWAVLIQLEHAAGVHQQLRVFFVALKEVPKSGEVWCEGARLFLNPHSECFSLDIARQFLEFAIEFTPQYGDSFIELMRLQMLLGSPAEEAERLWQLCINAEPNYGTLWFHCKVSVLLTTRQVLHNVEAVEQGGERVAPRLRRRASAAPPRVQGGVQGARRRRRAGAGAARPARHAAAAGDQRAGGGGGRLRDGVRQRCTAASRLDVWSKRALIYGGDLIVP